MNVSIVVISKTLLISLLLFATIVQSLKHRDTEYFQNDWVSNLGVTIQSTKTCYDRSAPGVMDENFVEQFKALHGYDKENYKLLCPEYMNVDNVCRDTCVRLHSDYDIFFGHCVQNETYVNITKNNHKFETCFEHWRKIACASACKFGYWNLLPNQEVMYSRICIEWLDRFDRSLACFPLSTISSRDLCEVSFRSVLQSLIFADFVAVKRVIFNGTSITKEDEKTWNFKTLFPPSFYGYHGDDFCFQGSIPHKVSPHHFKTTPNIFKILLICMFLSFPALFLILSFMISFFLSQIYKY